MKASGNINLVNASIELKRQNGQMGFNFYEWLRQVQRDLRPDLTIAEIWVNITRASCTEFSMNATIPLR